MKIQVKIMAIFILFFAFAIIACTPGGWGTDKTSTNTVMYNGNTNTDGTVPIDTNTYLPTFTVTVLGNGTITKTGYTFAGWNTQADGNGTDRAPGSTFAMGSSDVILYAKWTALPTYTVTYDANGGSGGLPADSNNYLAGATVTVLGNGTLTMAGYSFTCWNTQADGSGTALAPAATFAIGSSNVILYAVWTALPTYTVTYNNATGGNGVPPVDSNSYLAGATVTVLGDLSYVSWNTQADGSGTALAPAATFAMGSSNVTLYAQCSVSLVYGGLLSSGLGPPYGCHCDNLYVMQNGYCRLCPTGWNYSSGVCTCMPSKTKPCLQTHTVNYNANGGSGGLPFDGNSYLLGATVTVLGSGTLTNSGYVFAGWNTQADGSGTALAPGATFTMGSSLVILYAQWTLI